MSERNAELTWKRGWDPYVLALGILLVATLSVDSITLFSASSRQFYRDYLSLIPLIILVNVALAGNVRHAKLRQEQRFWTWLLASNVVYLGAEIAFAVFRHATGRFSGNLLVTILGLACPLCALIASEQRQDAGVDLAGSESRLPVRQAGYWLLGSVLFAYFDLIPAEMGAVQPGQFVPAWVAYLVLDLVVAFRYLALWLRCPSRPWKAIYGLIALASGLWCLSDTLNVLGEAHVLEMGSGTWMDVTFLLPLIPMLLSTRIRTAASASEADVPRSRSAPVETVTLTPSGLLLFLLPAMHICLGIFSPTPYRLEAARGILVALMMVVLYLLARNERKALNRLRVVADKKRSEAEQLFDLIFENAPDAYYLNDLKGTFVDGNRAAEQLIGYSREELIGKNFTTCGLLSGPHLCKVATLMAKNTLGVNIETGEEIVLNRKDGTPIEVEITAFPVEVDGRTLVLGIARDISHRKRLEEERLSLNEQLEIRLEQQTAELRKAEARFRMLVEQSLAGIYLLEGKEGRVSYVNPRAAEIFGFTQEEMVGQRAVDIVTEQDRPMMEENIRRRIDGVEPSIRATYRCRHKNGSLLDVEVHGARTDFDGRPAILGVAIDITEPKRVERALREAEEKYHEIFDNAVVGIFQTTPDGHYISANYALATMYGYTSPEELMSIVQDIEHQEYVDPRRRRQLMQLLERDGIVRDFAFEIYRKDGSHGWVSENSRAVRDASGNILYYEGTQEDITDRKLLERQLLASQKLEATGLLAGGIAHDFNNILNIVMGYAQLLLDPDASPALAHKGLTNILETSKRGAALTQQLLAFGRKQTLQLRAIDLTRTLSEVHEILGRVMGEDIKIVTEAHLPGAAIMADLNQIERMLINLAINAREAMPEGGRFVMQIDKANGEEIQLRSESGDPQRDYVHLTVSDTGCGMDAETLNHIFQPFFTTKPRGKGTGLGLAQVYGIVMQCNGSISATSQLGQGTAFHIYFPMVDAVPEARQRETVIPAVDGSGTILLVEDENLLRELIRIYLENSGFHVLEADTPAHALEVAGTYGKPIDLLVTDVIMPGMNGRQLAEAMMATHPALKVVYMSGYSDDKLALAGIRDSETTLVQKPFALEELASKIRQKVAEVPGWDTDFNSKSA
ncbi:MAG: PAS domain S-box protein [Acidobacteria bacterium]|nr:PAS domain S-box protein [Acidobacteriota bacterium]